MPYVSSEESVRVDRALRKGIEVSLKIRFGAAGLKLMPEIEEVYEEENLSPILEALETAESPDELRRFWAPRSES